MRGRKCMYYDELQIIFGNDTARGDNAISGADQFSPMDGTGIEDVEFTPEACIDTDTETTAAHEMDTQPPGGQETDTQ